MFVTKIRKQRWQKLEELLENISKSKISSISDKTLYQLGPLYRQTSIDLSLLRSGENSDFQLEAYLNHLVSRAHSVIYSIREGNVRSVWWFVKGGFASVIRRNFVFVLIAALIFFGTAAASFMAVKINPKLAYSLYSKEAIQYEEYRLEHHKGEYKGNFTFSLPESSFAAAIIIANILMVNIFCFAGGILYCLPCLLMLFFNGLMMGTFSGVIDNYGYTFNFFSLILTHGVWELTALCLSGGAGLILGYALISPGEFSRRDALRLRAREALQILAGTALMTIIAGFIEAYVTPHGSLAVRWIIISIMTLSLITYFLFAGREKSESGEIRI